MGSSAEDTEREIGRIRGDVDSTLAELQRRVRGVQKSVQSPPTPSLAPSAIIQEVGDAPPSLAAAAGVVVVGMIGYGVIAGLGRLRPGRKSRNPIVQQVRSVREELADFIAESGRKLEQERHRELLLKLDPDEGGYLRLSHAKLAPPAKKKRNSSVLKKLAWAALLSIFMAVSSVVARRVAGEVWRLSVREEPPTEKAKKS